MSKWKSKVVVVTGGSQGFGLAVVRAFAGRGATVVIVARNQERSQSVAGSMAEQGLGVHAIEADVCDPTSISRAVSAIINEHGRIDGWVNNVGRSYRRSIATATAGDYRESLESNLFSAIHSTSAALPHLEKQSGHLVNIGSLAAKTAWPFVAPYAVGKRALAAYHEQVRLEGPQSIHYLFVCPGPIRRDDAGVRYSDQTGGLPDAARQPGAGAPVKALDPDRLANQIVDACEKRKLELVVPFKSRILFAIAGIFPGLALRILRKKSRSQA